MQNVLPRAGDAAAGRDLSAGNRRGEDWRRLVRCARAAWRSRAAGNRRRYRARDRGGGQDEPNAPTPDLVCVDRSQPGPVLERVNNELLRNDAPMVTAITALVDARDCQFAYAAAGHPPAVLLEPGSGPASWRLGRFRWACCVCRLPNSSGPKHPRRAAGSLYRWRDRALARCRRGRGAVARRRRIRGARIAVRRRRGNLQPHLRRPQGRR